MGVFFYYYVISVTFTKKLKGYNVLLEKIRNSPDFGLTIEHLFDIMIFVILSLFAR